MSERDLLLVLLLVTLSVTTRFLCLLSRVLVRFPSVFVKSESDKYPAVDTGIRMRTQHGTLQ